MSSTAATLIIKVVTDTKAAAGGLDSVGKSASSFKDKISGAAKVAGAGLLALGAAAVVAGKAAAEDEQSQAILANTLKKSAGATKDSIAATEDWISKTSAATGVADDELRPALANLVRATGDVALSQKDMQIALDISASTGKDLSAVTTAMAKGYGGTTTALNKMLPSVAKTADKTGDFAAVMKEAGKQTEGAMAAKAGTAAGQMDIMNVSINEATESIGGALLPIMAKFANVAAKVANFIGKNATAFQIIIGIVAAFAAAIVILNAAISVYTTVTTLAGLAAEHAWIAALGPIALVIIAVVAIVAVFVLLYKKVKFFRDFVDAMWRGIKAGARAAASFFRAVWSGAVSAVRNTVSAFRAGFTAALHAVQTIARAVGQFFTSMWRTAFSVVRTLVLAYVAVWRTIITTIGDVIRTIAGKIKDGLGGAVTWLKDKLSPLGDFLTAPFDLMVAAIQKVIDIVEDLIGWISKIKIPDVGSALGKLNPFSVAPAPSTAGLTVGAFGAPRVAGAGAATTSTSAGGIHITVNGALDPESTARQIRRILEGHDRRVGLRTA